MTQKMKSNRAGSSGFTLIEIIIVLFIMAVVVSAVYALFAKSQRTYTGQDQLVELQQNLRSALEMMAQELRGAGYHPKVYSRIEAGIVTAEAQRIRFKADLDSSGSIEPGDEDVTYLFRAGVLYRNNGSGDQPIAENIIDFQIRYYLVADGTFRGILSTPPKRDYETQAPATAPVGGGSDQDRLNAIRVIRLEVRGQTANPDPDTTVKREYTLKVDVAMRNLTYRY